MRLSDLLLVCSVIAAPVAADELTIVSWGGAYEVAQRQAIIDPFAEETGLDVEVVAYDGTWTALAERGGGEGWDVIDMLADQARARRLRTRPLAGDRPALALLAGGAAGLHSRRARPVRRAAKRLCPRDGLR